jgi:glucosamine--fructose-6-phosphate aminotransferase (isomerizing)
MIEAVRKTVEQLKGTWALVIVHRDYPNKMWAVRNGSPLLLGTSPSCVMVASEQIAFHSYVNQYVVLKDHDVLEIEMTPLAAPNEEAAPEGAAQMVFRFNKNIHLYDKQTKTGENIELTPAPYEHWMLKEICEQPDAVLRAMNNGGRISTETTVKLGGLDALQSRLAEIDHLILLGCGTSYHAGLWSLSIFKMLEMFDTVSLYDGADFSGRDIPRRGKTAAVLLSQSGETKDLHRCVQIIQDHGLISIGVVNVIDSFIARETNCGVYLNAGREVAVASTKSFTNQCVVLSLLAVWFSQNRGTCEEKRRKIIADLHQLPFQMTEVVHPENLRKMENLAEKIRESKSVFLLGKGKEEAIAKEGALKIKEIARIHAEGYSTSALKHGPFGLLEPDLPVIILDIGDEYRDKTSNAIQEVQARETQTIILYDNKENPHPDGCWIEPNQTFGGLLSNICLQLIGYSCAVQKGFSPDYPRNLAKVVTVE